MLIFEPVLAMRNYSRAARHGQRPAPLVRGEKTLSATRAPVRGGKTHFGQVGALKGRELYMKGDRSQHDAASSWNKHRQPLSSLIKPFRTPALFLTPALF